ncbi:MAG: hypothetical protein HZB39_04670 [Planctomycetes bacterium]|nr:hypothetical protein [Planctomycetota bacterium]
MQGIVRGTARPCVAALLAAVLALTAPQPALAARFRIDTRTGALAYPVIGRDGFVVLDERVIQSRVLLMVDDILADDPDVPDPALQPDVAVGLSLRWFANPGVTSAATEPSNTGFVPNAQDMGLEVLWAWVEATDLLGGRLDATTALPVDASVLTGVELEHCHVLGDTIEAIAAEKAFVFREGGVGVSGCASPAAEVVAAHAARAGCRLLVCDVDFGVEIGPPSGGGERELVLWSKDGVSQPTRLDDAPLHEARLLALAWAAMRELLPGFVVPQRLARPALPGRFERRIDRDGQLVVLDGAHTEESTARLAEELARRWPGRRFAILFASARGKRWREALSRIVPLADHVVVTELSDTTSEDAGTICDWLRSRGVRVRAVPGAADGLAQLREHAGPRVVTGSFHLVGEVRAQVP